eukprot:gb/GECH01005038.1/.p1 GENE.gb/GECH01005038.1/~~gb/GECH01005038.1/.p1  ORF type:complete len:134 (+),score=27.80 gb/GECH01005038.1/:1-402(+)
MAVKQSEGDIRELHKIRMENALKDEELTDLRNRTLSEQEEQERLRKELEKHKKINSNLQSQVQLKNNLASLQRYQEEFNKSLKEELDAINLRQMSLGDLNDMKKVIFHMIKKIEEEEEKRSRCLVAKAKQQST